MVLDVLFKDATTLQISWIHNAMRNFTRYNQKVIFHN